MHTYTPFKDHFPDKPGLDSCTLEGCIHTDMSTILGIPVHWWL